MNRSTTTRLSAKSIPRFHYLLQITVISALLSGCFTSGMEVEKPNLLFVFAGQYRKHSVGFMNEDSVHTSTDNPFALFKIWNPTLNPYVALEQYMKLYDEK